MKLQYALPVWAETLPGIVPEEVRYCVHYDLTAEGRFLRDGYLAVTRERLFVLEGGRILRDIPLRQGTEIVCSPQVDSGLLLSRQDGEERFLCRFTMRHMVRISYVAKGATQFAAGIDRQVESRERELHCERCGRVLPGASLCPKCDGGRSLGLRHYWDLCSRYTLPLLLLTLLTGVVAVINVGIQFIQRDFIDNVLRPASGTLEDVARFFGIMLALTLAKEKGSMADEKYLEVIRELTVIPAKIKKILISNPKIAELSRIFTYAHNFLYLGRGYSFPVALEGALKLKEISYIHAEGYPAAEMKHGPIALIDAEMPVVVIATHNAMYEKIMSNIQEIKARKGKVIALVTEGDTVIGKLADDCIELPETLECLEPLIATVPLQLLAYHVAICKGKNVDQPRNLAKSVTVE